MCLWAVIIKKIRKKILFASLKSMKEGVDDPDPDPLVRGTVRTKMSRIPNTENYNAFDSKRTDGGSVGDPDLNDTHVFGPPGSGAGSGTGSGSISHRYGSGDPDLDPHQNVTDTQHCTQP